MANITATSGSPTANSYCTLAVAATYHETVLPADAEAWAELDTDAQTRLLIMATRLIDQHFSFVGRRATAEQALEWPRKYVPRSFDAPDAAFLADTSIPKAIAYATAEFARLLADGSTAADDDASNLKSLKVDVIELEFKDIPAAGGAGVVPTSVYSFLRRFGDYSPSMNSPANLVHVVPTARG